MSDEYKNAQCNVSLKSWKDKMSIPFIICINK